jgi:hypothetical protein
MSSKCDGRYFSTQGVELVLAPFNVISNDFYTFIRICIYIDIRELQIDKELKQLKPLK